MTTVRYPLSKLVGPVSAANERELPMGTVFKKTVTKSLPEGAEILTRKGQRFARWRNAKGKLRNAQLTTGKDGADRITIESSTYYAKYRDGGRIVRVVPTGCKD